MKYENIYAADLQTQTAVIRFGVTAVFASFFPCDPLLQGALLDQPAKDFLAALANSAIARL